MTDMDAEIQVLRENTKPLYEQIYEYLNGLIKSKQLTPGEKIPSEKELESLFNVSRITIRRAIQELVFERKVVKIPGKGSFVLEPRVEPLSALTSFNENMVAQGYEPSYKSSKVSLTIPHTKISTLLNTDKNERVLNIHRFMLANNIPMAIQDSYLPASIYEKRPELFIPELLDKVSLYRILEIELGLSLFKADEWVDTSKATEEEAKILEIDVGDLVMIIERVSYTTNEEPIEYVKMLYPAERYRYKVQLFRPQK